MFFLIMVLAGFNVNFFDLKLETICASPKINCSVPENIKMKLNWKRFQCGNTDLGGEGGHGFFFFWNFSCTNNF